MKFSVQTLNNIYSEHFWLELSDSDLEVAKPIPQDYSNESGRNRAYLNRLCLNAFLKWMQEILGLEASLTIFPNEKILPKIWEFVNGCEISLGSKRLVLIPSDAVDIADFAVPKEWVDLPNWAADYYLPVSVDLEEQYLHFWGFVSRQTLKFKADRDRVYRLYYVERDLVIPNLELLEVASNLCANEKGEVTLPKLSETEAENLIEELSKPSPYSPRLKVTFEKWGALLNESHWLEKLYERRVQPVSVSSPLWVLNRWLDGVVEEGWQTFEDLFNAKVLAPAFRAKRVRGIELETPEKIKQAVRQLYNSQKEVVPPNIEEQDALIYLIENTPDESIRWKAVEYLWTINPNYQGSAIRRVMDLGVQLMGHPIALMVAVLRKLDGQVAVLLRAYPMFASRRDRFDQRTQLPPGLRLIGLYENGAPIPGLEAVARSEPQDDYISLYFNANVGDRFNVQLTLENVTITEQFVV